MRRFRRAPARRVRPRFRRKRAARTPKSVATNDPYYVRPGRPKAKLEPGDRWVKRTYAAEVDIPRAGTSNIYSGTYAKNNLWFNITSASIGSGTALIKNPFTGSSVPTVKISQFLAWCDIGGSNIKLSPRPNYIYKVDNVSAQNVYPREFSNDTTSSTHYTGCGFAVPVHSRITTDLTNTDTDPLFAVTVVVPTQLGPLTLPANIGVTFRITLLIKM